MLRRIIILSVFFIFTKANAQQGIIAGTDIKVFYVGLPNPIQVMIEGIKPKDLIVIGENCELTGGNGIYNVKVELRPIRTCTIKAGKLNRKKDTLWLKQETFKIRPRPYPSFTVNGKEGGSITKPELQVWSFINASYGVNFVKDGFSMQVTGYSIKCYSQNKVITNYRSSPTVDAALKHLFMELEPGDVITLYDFKYTDKYNKDTLVSNKEVTFTVAGHRVEQSVNNNPVLSLPNDLEKEYGGSYVYAGPKKENKKHGLWITFQKDNMEKKIAETLYDMDTILEERKYYGNGNLSSEIKYSIADSVADFTTWYMNGKICSKGKYKGDNENAPILDLDYGPGGKDLIFNDTTGTESGNITYYYSSSRVPYKALFGEWIFYYANGMIAAKGNFIITKTESHGHSDEPSQTTYYNYVTRDGEWKYYLPGGLLFHTVIYKSGDKINEVFYH